MKITHYNGTTDKRYDVVPRQSDQPTSPAHAALFCGEYIGQAGTDWQAWLVCAEHKAARIGGNSGDYLNGKKGL